MNKKNLPSRTGIPFEATRVINIKDIAENTIESNLKKNHKKWISLKVSLILATGAFFAFLIFKPGVHKGQSEIENLQTATSGSGYVRKESTSLNQSFNNNPAHVIGDQNQNNQPVYDNSDRYSRYEEESYYANAVEYDESENREPASSEVSEVSEEAIEIETPAPAEAEF
jgi:hypothetical protein